MFRRNLLAFFLLSKSKPRKTAARNQQEAGGKKCSMDSFLAYFSSLKIEAVYFSETPMNFFRTTRRYIPENSNLLFIVV
jgi:hypothetical protein